MTDVLITLPDGKGYTREGDPGEPSTDKPRVSIASEEEKILAAFAYDELVLEIGTGLGISTRALAQHADWVFTVDIDEWVQQTIWPELQADIRRLTCLTDPADLRNITPSLVFIDGDHTTDAVRRDVETATRALSKGGVILAHDCNYDTVKLALDDEWTFLRTTHGIAVKVVLP